MHWWMNLVGSLATIALILTGFGIMLRIVKTDDVLKRIAAILGIVILLMLIPGILVSAWSALSLWQQIVLIAIGIGVVQLLRPRRQARKRRGG
jgi:Ca2+/Na+ antiporter